RWHRNPRAHLIPAGAAANRAAVARAPPDSIPRRSVRTRPRGVFRDLGQRRRGIPGATTKSAERTHRALVSQLHPLFVEVWWRRRNVTGARESPAPNELTVRRQTNPTARPVGCVASATTHPRGVRRPRPWLRGVGRWCVVHDATHPTPARPGSPNEANTSA